MIKEIIQIIETYHATNFFIFLTILIAIAILCNKRGRKIAITMTCGFVVSLGIFLWMHNNLYEHNIIVNSSLMVVIGFITGAFFRFVSKIHDLNCEWGKPDTYLIPKETLEEINLAPIDKLKIMKHSIISLLTIDMEEFNNIPLNNKNTKIRRKLIKVKIKTHLQICEYCDYLIKKNRF